MFDTETTGLDPGVEYLTEIGAVLVRNGRVAELIPLSNPANPLHPRSQS